MTRIRTIKPEMWQDEKVSVLPPVARLVFIGLISMADDAGRIVDNVKSIDGFLFPSTEDTSREALDILAKCSRIIRYTAASGQKLIQISNWTKHQKVDKPSRHTLPAPTVEDVAAQQLSEQSRDCREGLDESSRSDLGPRTKDLGSRTEDHSAGADEVTEWPKEWAYETSELFLRHSVVIPTATCGVHAKPLKNKIPWSEWLRVVERMAGSGDAGYGLPALLRRLPEFRDDTQLDPNRPLTLEEAMAL